MTTSRVEFEKNKYYDNTFKILGIVLFVLFLEYPVYPVCFICTERFCCRNIAMATAAESSVPNECE